MALFNGNNFSLAIFIVIELMDLKSIAVLSDHPHHPLHPDWEFTYHRVFPRGNASSNANEAGTKERRTGIAAMSIAAFPNSHKGMSSLKGATTTMRENLNPKRWSSILEQELERSLAQMPPREKEFHWRPWIHRDDDEDDHLVELPRRHQRHRRRHWKRHHHFHSHANTHHYRHRGYG